MGLAIYYCQGKKGFRDFALITRTQLIVWTYGWKQARDLSEPISKFTPNEQCRFKVVSVFIFSRIKKFHWGIILYKIFLQVLQILSNHIARKDLRISCLLKRYAWKIYIVQHSRKCEPALFKMTFAMQSNYVRLQCIFKEAWEFSTGNTSRPETCTNMDASDPSTKIKY